MLRFLMMVVLKFGKTKGFSKFITKYGQKAFDKIQNKLGPNTKFSTNSSTIIKLAKKSAARNIKKTVPKSKPVKHKTELQRVKEQIVRDKLKPKIKTPKGKIIGKVRRNYGKWEHVYQKPPKIKSLKMVNLRNYKPKSSKEKELFKKLRKELAKANKKPKKP